MGTMTDFWAREWLEDIAPINDLDTAIQIGQEAAF